MQKQVDFLEANQDFGLSYSRAQMYDQEGRTIVKIIGSNYEGYDKLLIDNVICTLTVCMRAKFFKQYIEAFGGYFMDFSLGDYPIWLFVAANSNIHHLPDVTAVYRKLSESASHSSSFERQLKFYSDINRIKLFFLDHYRNKIENPVLVKKIIKDQYAWVKYRVLIKADKQNSYLLSQEEYKNLTSFHKGMVILNKILAPFGIFV